MGKIYTAIDDDLKAWLAAQHMFFVATAPSGDDGHVNCSPKGRDTFRVIGPTEVAYMDFAGSGIETVAHVQQNGRICLMFCSFEQKPRIVRLHGKACVLAPSSERYAGIQQRLGGYQLGMRSIVHVECTRIADSCGFGVPLYDFVGARETLNAWAEKKGADGVREYVKKKNAESIDGLPGLG